MKPYHAVIFALLVGGATAGITAWRLARPLVPAPALASSTAPDLRGELAELRGALRGELSSLRSELRKNAAVPPPGPSAQVAAGAFEAVPSPPVTVEDAHAIKVLELAAQVETERADPVWSARTEQQVTTALARGTAPGTRLRDVKCGATLCRATVEHDDAAAQKQLASHIASVPPFDYGVVYAPQENEHATVLFVMRPGQDGLPGP